MNEKERLAIVWDNIERLAFRPNPSARWLSVYAKTMHRLWGEEPRWNYLRPVDEFFVTFLNLKCCYSIENVEKYSVSLTQNPIPDRCYWQNHIDPDYLSKGSPCSANGRYPLRFGKQREKLPRDIRTVLDGMIFHPRCHTHLGGLGIRHVQLDQDRGGLSSHEIRIGGGIENPYVFLFHLRYQFCLVAENVRVAEKRRLIGLFEEAIVNRDSAVNARDLFDFKPLGPGRVS